MTAALRPSFDGYSKRWGHRLNMKHVRTTFCILGWLLILAGFFWIVNYSVIQVRLYFEFKTQVQALTPSLEDMSKADLLKLHQETRDMMEEMIDDLIQDRGKMLWAGLLMLSGVAVIQVTSIGKAKKPQPKH
jgi:hypothetical protein